MEMHDLRGSVEHDFTVDSAGKVQSVRVRVVQGEGIIVWAGELDAMAKDKPSDKIEPSDFVKRTVVHFVNWSSVRDFYEGTPFASLIESIRGRTLRFSTVPTSASNTGK